MKEPLGRPRRRWVDNIKEYLWNNIKENVKDIEWVGMDWIDLAQERDE
jgi:hypothetical protein